MMASRSQPSSLAEKRTRSLGRSGARNPSELLARKQQLLSGVDSAAEDSGQRRRSLVRRAHQLAAADAVQGSSAEAKLESLSELLKSHQSSAGELPVSGAKSIEDVYILLAKKEKDLQFAAEFGKALLERNTELSRASETITEEFVRKLEALEQEKHWLQLKLDQQDGEHENRLIELQADCNILKNQLNEQQQLASQREKEKSKLIDDLVQQNQRLTSELVEATKSEELLSSQLEQMNERFNVRISSRQDHVTQLDALNEEIQIVNQRKQDLERRLKLANQDKSNLAVLLEDSGDKILLLENLLNEKDAKLSQLMEEMNELHDTSFWLSSELEAMISLNERLASSAEERTSGSNGRTDLELASDRKRSQLVEQLRQLHLSTQSRMKASEMRLARHRARAGTGAEAGAELGQTQLGSKRRRKEASLLEELELERTSTSASDERASPAEGAVELERDMLTEIFALLRRFQAALQLRKEGLLSSAGQHLYSPNSTDDSGISADELDKPAGEQSQQNDPAEWRRLLDSLKSLIEEMPCSSCQLMIGERADYEQLQRLHAKLCDEMRKKSDQLLSVSIEKTEQETKLAACEQRCATLSQDLSNCDKPKEEIVKLAWKARDEAVERKNSAEIALAKTRIENMQIASQLMEVVQQKGELSQKLAQFEDDIHYITQDSVKAKFTWEEYAEKQRRSKTTQPDSANPLAQLLSFSMASSRDTNANQANNAGNKTKSSAVDNNLTQPAASGLMRNFTSNRFNLRFWQRSSSEKAMDKGSVVTNSNSSDNSPAITAQKASQPT